MQAYLAFSFNSSIEVAKATRRSWLRARGAASTRVLAELTIGILAVIAEHERKAISARTKAALAAAKALGVKLGHDNVKALRRVGVGQPGWTKGAEANRHQANRFAGDLNPVIDDIIATGTHQPARHRRRA